MMDKTWLYFLGRPPFEVICSHAETRRFVEMKGGHIKLEKVTLIQEHPEKSTTTNTQSLITEVCEQIKDVRDKEAGLRSAIQKLKEKVNELDDSNPVI